MAKYLLIQFDRNEDADAFAQSLMNAPDTTLHLMAVYQKPTQFCECEEPDDKSVRGQKYGFWVCTKCKKPRAGLWQSPTNQLRPDEHIGRRRMQLSIVEPQPDTYERDANYKAPA